jgi:hypothetical protein
MTQTTEIFTLLATGFDPYVMHGGHAVGHISTKDLPNLEALPGVVITEKKEDD